MRCCVEPGLRLGAVAGRRARERQAWNPVVQPARQHPSDGAEAGDGNAGHEASPIPQSVIRAADIVDKRGVPCGCGIALTDER